MEQNREPRNKPQPQEASCVIEKVIERSDKEIGISTTLWSTEMKLHPSLIWEPKSRADGLKTYLERQTAELLQDTGAGISMNGGGEGFLSNPERTPSLRETLKSRAVLK